VDCIKVTMESVKNFAWNQMDAMWHDGSGLATVDMVKFKFNGYFQNREQCEQIFLQAFSKGGNTHSRYGA